MKKIIFTGGGTAGHVTPNLALIKKFHENNWQVYYIGSETGIENELISKINIPYYKIKTGKLRRYFSWQTLLEPLRILIGIIQATYIIRKIKPDVIFSKGGFVSFPVVVSAWMNRIPTAIHESDLTPGLANKLSYPFVTKICLSFEKTKACFKNQNKLVVTGTPIRREFFSGDKQKGLAFLQFKEDMPVLLIIGGGQGALSINQVIHQSLPELLQSYQIAHICGKNKLSAQFQAMQNYKQYEYLHNELYDVMACADKVISRSGANALVELVALKKLHILIPLSTKASRGDQLHNAAYFSDLGISKVVKQEELNQSSLIKALEDLDQHRDQYLQAMNRYAYRDGSEIIYNLLCNFGTEVKGHEFKDQV